MYSTAKRSLDLLVAGIALIILSPLFMVIIAILSITADREIFFVQQRIGYHFKPFGILKFSSMRKNSAGMGLGTLTVRNDPRVTSFGRFLRITKINELPQIINVLKGEMSLVGPRPLLFKDFDNFPQNLKEAIFHSVPGITGIGPIVFRDEEILVSRAEDPLRFHIQHIQPYKGDLELWYLGNKSFILDLKIIFLTAWVILFKKSNLVFRMFGDLPKKPSTLEL